MINNNNNNRKSILAKDSHVTLNLKFFKNLKNSKLINNNRYI